MTTWIGPDTEGYDEQRALFNAMIDKRPRVIAACAGTADVREALERAARDGLAVAVRSGGHSVAGQSSNDDGLVVDVRPMKGVEIDVAARRARVGAGCTWGELDAATQQHGLATTGGRISSTGVTGLTLADDDANIAWVREYRRANAPFTTGGVYLNFIGDEGDERIRAAFGAEKYERLSQIKGEYDPGNVFVGNQNIRPRATV